MDRKPKRPPFAVGTRLRYTGTLRMWSAKDDPTPSLEPGMVGVVVETRPGHQGTLLWIDLHDGEEPVQDTTDDGWSVVQLPSGLQRIAEPDQWERVR